jgi:hypothetical protein
LYVGIGGLVLATLALRRNVGEARFWGGAALVALVLSGGANSPLYHLTYNLLPGASLFRGQERAALVFAAALALLAALGAAALRTTTTEQRAAWRGPLLWLALVCGVGAVGVWLLAPSLNVTWWIWVDDGDRERVTMIAGYCVVTAFAAWAAWAWLPHYQPTRAHKLGLALWVGLPLLALHMNSPYNYSDGPTPSFEPPPPLVAAALPTQRDVWPYRVDGGQRDLIGNAASVYGLLDIRGISPLFLRGPHRLIQATADPRRAWELFAVRDVFSDWAQLPAPSTLVASADGPLDVSVGRTHLHRLRDPRPFAWLVYRAAVVDSDEFAYALLADARFNPREDVILLGAPPLLLPNATPPRNQTSALVTLFLPERISITVDTPDNAILTLAMPYASGWRAELNGQATPILRAYGATMAIAVPQGAHTITVLYDPLSFRVGAWLSAGAWLALIVGALMLAVRRMVAVRRMAARPT